MIAGEYSFPAEAGSFITQKGKETERISVYPPLRKEIPVKCGAKKSKYEISNKSGGECWVVMKHLYPHQAGRLLILDQASDRAVCSVMEKTTQCNI